MMSRGVAIVCPNNYGVHKAPVIRYLVVMDGGEKSRWTDDPTWDDLQAFKRKNPKMFTKIIFAPCRYCAHLAKRTLKGGDSSPSAA